MILAFALWAGAAFASEPWISFISNEERLEIARHDVERAEIGVDYKGEPALFVRLKPDATRAFGELTYRIVGKQMEVLHNGELLTSPFIRSPILAGSFHITGLDKDALSALLEALSIP